MKKLCLLLLLSTSIFAQEKTSNNDLRTDVELFSIKYKKEMIVLERSKLGSHQLVFNDGGKDIRAKVDSKEAKEIDELFSDKFIHLKYLLESNFKKVCKNEIELSLRGELFQICLADESREPVVKEIMKNLNKKKA